MHSVQIMFCFCIILQFRQKWIFTESRNNHPPRSPWKQQQKTIMSPSMNQKKKINELYFSSIGIDFERTRMYGDFDWSGSRGRTWFQGSTWRNHSKVIKNSIIFQKNMAPNRYAAPDIAKIWLFITIAPEHTSIFPLVQAYCKVVHWN